MTNDERAEMAARALEIFVREKTFGRARDVGSGDILAENVQDLITNLCHLLDRDGQPVWDPIQNAVAMFHTEKRWDA